MQIITELKTLIDKMESEFIADINNSEAEINYSPEYIISKLNEIKSIISNYSDSDVK
jgi:hypothetical protein